MPTHDSPEFLTSIGYEIVTHLARGIFGSMYLAKLGADTLAVKVPRGRPAVLPDYTPERARTYYQMNIDHLEAEHLAYVRAEGIRGIPDDSKREFYPPDFFKNGAGKEFALDCLEHKGVVVITRTFIPGKQMEAREVITEESHRKRLEKTVRELHEAGITRLDIERKNTILSSRGKPFLIDFGYCLFEEDVTESVFRKHCQEDFANLKKLYRLS